MGIAKRKDNGSYTVRVYSKGQIIVQKGGFKKKAEAQRFYDKTLAKFKENPEEFLEDIRYTFDDLIERFVEIHLPTVRPSTRMKYTYEIELRIEPFFRYMPLARITANRLEDFKLGLIRSNLAPKSINICMNLLKAILDKAVKWDMLNKNPYNLEPLKVPKRDDDYAWWDDVKYIRLFLEEARKSTKYYPIYVLALETGMRQGEILALSKSDVDLENGRIRIRRSWGTKTKIMGPTKGGRIRFVDFNPESWLATILRNAISQSVHEEFIFTTSSGEMIGQTEIAGKTFNNIMERAGVPKIRFHDLRHTFATWYMIKTDNIRHLQQLLGHATVATTEKYLHVSARHKKAPLELSEMLFDSIGDDDKLCRIGLGGQKK